MTKDNQGSKYLNLDEKIQYNYDARVDRGYDDCPPHRGCFH